MFGDVSVDDKVVTFPEMTEETSVTSKEDALNLLTTEPFRVNDNSKITLNLQYGSVKKEDVSSLMAQGENDSTGIIKGSFYKGLIFTTNVGGKYA